jgi:hypothetical protein
MAAEGAALRVDLDRASTLVAIAHEAQTRLRTRYPVVHMAAAFLAMWQGNFDQARRDAGAAVDLARATQDPFELANALTLYATTLQPDNNHAAVAAEEAVGVAREAELPLPHALFLLSTIIAHEQPARAYALLDEAADIARKIGDDWWIASTLAHRASLALLAEDWPTALRIATDAAEQDLQLGGSTMLGAIFRNASGALAHLQVLEPAAVLAGFTGGDPAPMVGQEWYEDWSATEQLLLDTLGPTRTAELKAHGSTLSNADALVYLRSQCDQALADDRKQLTDDRD